MGSVDVMNRERYAGSTWSSNEFWLETVLVACRAKDSIVRGTLEGHSHVRAFALAGPSV